MYRFLVSTLRRPFRSFPAQPTAARSAKAAAPRLALTLALTLAFAALPALAADEAPGQAIFMAQKCNTCHSIAAVGVEAKIASPKMAGPDLSGFSHEDFSAVAAYLRKEAELDGVMHKREIKVSDEDLHTLLDWLASLEPADAASR